LLKPTWIAVSHATVAVGSPKEKEHPGEPVLHGIALVVLGLVDVDRTRETCNYGKRASLFLGATSEPGGDFAMVKSKSLKLTVLAASCALVLVAQAVRAETLVEDNVESRVLLAFQVDAATLQKRLSPDLEVSPIPAGPAKDANLLVIFYERLSQQDAAAKATGAPAMQYVAIVAPVKSKATGKPAYAVLRVFSPNPEQVPGFYRAGVLASVKREFSSAAEGLEPGRVKDAWEVKTQGADSIRLRLDFARATPARSQRESQILSAADATLFRIYRTDELAEVIRSVPAKIDRAKRVEFRARISDMADLFVPSPRLVGAVHNPVSLRKVFLPDPPAAAAAQR
jgi:hypothetical protein